MIKVPINDIIIPDNTQQSYTYPCRPQKRYKAKTKSVHIKHLDEIQLSNTISIVDYEGNIVFYLVTVFRTTKKRVTYTQRLV